MLSGSSSPDLIQRVDLARRRGMRLRPVVGGFPHLAEALRQAGIRTVHCDVASMTTRYETPDGTVVDQPAALVAGLVSVAPFDGAAVVSAVRTDQRGESTYAEFMAAIWRAGVVSYDVDLELRTCTYVGVEPTTERYVEDYPAVELADVNA